MQIGQTDMKIIERMKKDRKLSLSVIGMVIATFVVPYLTIPGLILWWFYKKSKFSKKFKTFTTSIVGGLAVILMMFGFIAYAKDVEPHLSISEPTSATSVKAQQIDIKGTYDPSDRKVWINGNEITASNGSFETTYQLKEGENKIEVTAGNWKRARVNLTITRELTDEEIAARATPTPKSSSVTTQEPTKAPQVTKQATSAPQPTQPSQTPQQMIETKIRASVKKRTNMDKDKIAETRVNKAFDNDKEYVVFVSINGDDNFSEDWIKKSIWGDMTDIYIALYKQPVGVREATIVANFPMKDKYGNTSDEVVMKTSLEATEAKKVNWNEDEATLSLRILPNVWDTQINLFK